MSPLEPETTLFRSFASIQHSSSWNGKLIPSEIKSHSPSGNMWYLCAQFPPQEPRGWKAAPSMVYRWRWPIFSLAQNSIISEHQISVCICRWDATICVAGLGNWVGRRWPRAIDSFDRRMSTRAVSRSQSIPKGGMFPEEEFAGLMEIECLETVPRNSFEENWNSSWKGSPRCGLP